MFWHFKLFWAAALVLQCGFRTQGAGVSLRCSQEGAAPAINCTIQTEMKCMGYEYLWMDSKDNSICMSGDSNCEWDNRTFVSLVFTRGAKCETYKVFIETSCGIANSDISVTHCINGKLRFSFCVHICERILTDYDHCLNQGPPSILPVIPPTNGPPESPVVNINAGIIVVLTVLIILFILCTIMIKKGIFKNVMKDKRPCCLESSYI